MVFGIAGKFFDCFIEALITLIDFFVAFIELKANIFFRTLRIGPEITNVAQIRRVTVSQRPLS